MKEAFRNWYVQAYESVLASLINENDILLFNSLLSQLEIEALKHYDGEETVSIKNRIKSLLIFWITKRQIRMPENITSVGNNCDLLFWPTQAKHTKLHVILNDALIAQGIKTKFIRFENNFAQVTDMASNNVSTIDFSDRLKFSFNLKRIRWSIKVSNAARKIKPFNLNGRLIRYVDIVKDARAMLYMTESVKSMFQIVVSKVNPKVIITGYELSLQSRTLGILARKHSIKTASLQIGRLHYPLMRFVLLDYIYLYGTKSTNYFNRSQNATTKAIAAGSLKVENFAGLDIPSEVKNFVSEVKKAYEKFIVVAFTGPGIALSENGHKKNVDTLFEVAAENSNLFYLIKLNTKDDIKYYHKFAELSNIVLIDKNNHFIQYDIIHWLKECDYMISAISTSAMQAMRFSKPVISLDVLGEFADNYLIQEEAIIYAGSTIELMGFTQSLMDRAFTEKMSKLSQHFAQEYFQYGNISSASFIAEHLKTNVLTTV